MKEAWQSHLQIGVVHNMAFPECLGGEGPQFETLREICYDPFFEAVDVGPIFDPKQRRECGALLRDCQMSVMMACQPVLLLNQLDLNAEDDGQRRRAVDAIVNCLEHARDLNADRIALMSGKNVPPQHRRAAVDRLLDSLRTICCEARNRVGLPIVLEIFDYDIDKKALVGTCSLAAEVAREMRRDFPDFGLLHDLSHIYLCHEEPAIHLPAIREYLVAMHMGNSVSNPQHAMYGDTHPQFGLSGGDSSVAELRNFIKVLFDIGYLRSGRRPVCGFELRPPKGVASQTMIANMKRTWQKAWYTL